MFSSIIFRAIWKETEMQLLECDAISRSLTPEPRESLASLPALASRESAVSPLRM